MMQIPFHKPFYRNEGLDIIASDLKDHLFDEAYFIYNLNQAFMNTEYAPYIANTRWVDSATSAMEIMALFYRVQKGDEIIIPSFTYAATANAFAKMGATLVFVDIEPETLNLDWREVEKAITSKTKAIVPIHYGGVSADMTRLLTIADSSDVLLLEDAAHGLGAGYGGALLGTMGQMGCLSFHKTKNITSGGRGGCLFCKDSSFLSQIDAILDQGTNRLAMEKGEIKTYKWERLGGEYRMPNYQMAYLTESMKFYEAVNSRHRLLWRRYYDAFKLFEKKEKIRMTVLTDKHVINGHIFFLKLSSETMRLELQKYLNARGIQAFAHYQPLHLTKIGVENHILLGDLSETEKTVCTLLRMPIYYELTDDEQSYIIHHVTEFLKNQ